jgi:hypothetical protein
MFGIFGCGSSKKNAILLASKSGLFAIVANGGASLVAPRWFDATTWQGAHHRRARRSPLSGSAPNAGVIAKVAAAIKQTQPDPRGPTIATISTSTLALESCVFRSDQQ